ncbi:putative bifunctional diguanylate cyclase/phosphodiesterase [Massilia sp. SM-13]|uniref:putative bifunctional diguanylate cyclase/phosphodiesterase n=1 Tax=Pseudoduganella rhizocola TaxID=3382643 RepID=UPI0038B63037
MLPLTMPPAWLAPSRSLHADRGIGRASQSALSPVLDSGYVGLACFDADDVLLNANMALCSVLGRTTEQLAGTSFVDLFAVDEAMRGVGPGAAPQAGWSAVRLLGCGETGPALMLRLQGQHEDETARSTIVAIGNPGVPHHIDPLTGALNAAAFTAELERAVARHSSGTGFVLLLLTVNRFQSLAAVYGHAACDRLLRDIAQRLRSLTRWRGLVGRLRDEEFGVIVARDTADDIGLFTQQLVAAVCESYQLDGEEVLLTVAAGVSSFPEHGRAAEALSRAAETALTHARSRRGPAVQLFDAELGWSSRRRAELERSLRKALQRGEFEIEYQPRIELQSMQVTAMEALLRWNHPQLGRIPPLEFIGLAEEQGVIADIGRWVLNEACAFARLLSEQRAVPLRVSVNISAQQLKDDQIIDDICSALDCTRLPPRLLELELTESLLVDDHERCSALFRRLKDLGLILSVDDFGTGYSSLAYLQAFPVDTIKLDKSFVNRGGSTARNLRLLKALVDLAHALDLEVVAEGVEEPEVLQFLHGCRCNEVQGYLVSRPLGPEAFRRFLRSYTPAAADAGGRQLAAIGLQA